MSVARKVNAWRETVERRDRSANGAVKRINAVDRAAWGIANEPTASMADLVDKLRFARHDLAERGVTDRCVLVLLDNLIRDAARLADAPLSDHEIAAADERTTLDVRSLISRGLPIDTKTDCIAGQPNIRRT